MLLDSPRRATAQVEGNLMRSRSRFLLPLALAGATLAGPFPASWGQTMPPRDLTHGKELFVRYCSGCHGEDGRGEAKTFRPSVANLSVKELMDKVTDDYLFAVIKDGGVSVGKNAAMPAWKSQLGDQEIWDIVGFVRTLARR
jgi:mono/diheme cytochrome c family protein